MGLLTQLMGTVLGFIVVMASASMIVAMVVRALHALTGERGQTVMDMLAAINQGYRAQLRDMAEPGDDPEQAFVLDVLGHPALHSHSGMQAHATAAERRATTLQTYLEQRRTLARRVEHVRKVDLLRVVRELSRGTALPWTWHRQLGATASYGSFEQYIEAWWPSAEALSTERFRKDSRRLAAVLSSLLVIAVNLDALQLVSRLWNDTTAQQLLSAAAPGVLKTYERIEYTSTRVASFGDENISGIDQVIEQGNAILSEPALGLGWTQSKIVRQYCAFRADCAEAAGLKENVPSALGLVISALLWLTGLLVSCFALALGAPFWADRLRDLLNLRNALAPPKPRLPDTKPSV